MTTLKRHSVRDELDKQAIVMLAGWMGKQLNDVLLSACMTRAEFYQLLSNGIRLGQWIDSNTPTYGLAKLLHPSLPTPCTTPTELARARENLSHVLVAIRNIYRLKTIDLFEPSDLLNDSTKDNVLSCLVRLIPLMSEAPVELKSFAKVYFGGGGDETKENDEGTDKQKAARETKQWEPTTDLDQLVYTTWMQCPHKTQITKEKEDGRGTSGVYSFQRHKVTVTIIRKRPFVQVGAETLPLSRFLDNLQ